MATLNTILSSPNQDAKDKNVVDDIFKGLDQDGSGSVDFTEFVTMVAAITAVTHEMLCQ